MNDETFPPELNRYEVISCGRGTVRKNWSKNLIPHPSHRLYSIHKGSAKMISIEGSSIKLLPKHIYLFPSGRMRESHCDYSMDHSFINFQTLYPFESEQLNRIPLSNGYIPENKNYANALFAQIFENRKNTIEHAPLLINAGITLLLAPFLQLISPATKEQIRFRPVLRYIEKNLDKPILLESLSAILRIDTIYFSSIFAKYTGLSPRQYIIKKQIEKSQQLLFSTNLKVKEIAVRVGIEDDRYFSRLFKNKTQITPLNYREKSRNELSL